MWFFIRLKQPPKVFKKSYLGNRSKTAAYNSDVAICNNSLKLKIVNCSIVTRSSILDVGSGPGLASDYYGILRKFL